MKRAWLFLLTMIIVSSLFAVTTIKISGWPGNPDEEAAIKAGLKNLILLIVILK
ncbi:hypothetical protein [Marinitoga lauensis]|uniref:hypothetical protein n=1 Tax=Marinitoga lauensis TaxID=2201189 RepID=UPI00197FA961|nr:hypothetical protein [Marinitoga lauensis]